jgi:hypothetical protein
LPLKAETPFDANSNTGIVNSIFILLNTEVNRPPFKNKGGTSAFKIRVN